MTTTSVSFERQRWTPPKNMWSMVMDVLAVAASAAEAAAGQCFSHILTRPPD
jgi:hypothetical protein